MSSRGSSGAARGWRSARRPRRWRRRRGVLPVPPGERGVAALDATENRAIRHHYDLVLDVGGDRPLAALRRLLTPNGTLVFMGGEGGDRVSGGLGRQLRALMLAPFVGQRLGSF